MCGNCEGGKCEGGSCGPCCESGGSCSEGSCGSSCGSCCGPGGSCSEGSCCGESCGEGCCESESGLGCGCPSPGELAAEISFLAFKEALKDRVRKKMEASMGKKLDQIADLVLEGMGAHMQMHKAFAEKMETMQSQMQKRDEWAKKLADAMFSD